MVALDELHSLGHAANIPESCRIRIRRDELTTVPQSLQHTQMESFDEFVASLVSAADAVDGQQDERFESRRCCPKGCL